MTLDDLRKFCLSRTFNSNAMAEINSAFSIYEATLKPVKKGHMSETDFVLRCQIKSERGMDIDACKDLYKQICKETNGGGDELR